jgi:hypothetical protein
VPARLVAWTATTSFFSPGLRDLASWFWRLGGVALALAALCAAIGFAVSRRSLLGRERQPLITGDY